MNNLISKTERRIAEILSDDDVKQNCAICTKIKDAINSINFELEHNNIIELIEKKTCLECIVSLAKRKYAYLYTMQYLDEYDVAFFKTNQVRSFIEMRCPFHNLINPHVIKVVMDLLVSELIEVYNNKGRRTYKVIESKDCKDCDEIRNFCLLRGFGQENGIKTT